MKRHLIIYIALLLSFVGCRTDDYIVYMEDEDIGIKTEPTDVLGMYVLNEGKTIWTFRARRLTICVTSMQSAIRER